jgi:hypothetical protein
MVADPVVVFVNVTVSVALAVPASVIVVDTYPVESVINVSDALAAFRPATVTVVELEVRGESN